MTIRVLPCDFTVCQIGDLASADLTAPFTFLSRTDEELSLVCPTDRCPAEAIRREDGWKGFGICGELDFSLIGILAGISKILAENAIGIFAISTYNTDYILTKEKNFEKAIKVLADAGYEIDSNETAKLIY